MTEYEPGPALDARMAEEVMGWTVLGPTDRIDGKRGVLALYAEVEDDQGEIGMWLIIHRGNGAAYWDRWSPSTNIADAWEPFLWIATKAEIGVKARFMAHLKTLAEEKIGAPVPDKMVWLVLAEAMPHAICLAALRSVER